MKADIQNYLGGEIEDLSAKEGLERIDLTVKKMSETEGNLNPFDLAQAAVPKSSFCTSACFSTVSSITSIEMPENETVANAAGLAAHVRLLDADVAALGLRDATLDAEVKS